MTVRTAPSFLLAALLCLVPACAGASALDLAPTPIGGEARLAAIAGEPQSEPGAGLEADPSGAARRHGPAGAALRSLLIPGWGQLSNGHHTQAAIFGTLEVGTWAAFGTFRRQGALRRNSYFATARLFAGIELADKPTSYRKLVGQYRSSDVFNQYVVLREAAYFYDDPTARAQYIASRTITAENAWSWGDSYDEFVRYRAQRRSSEQAFKNAQYTLGFALVNRVVSAVAAARSAARASGVAAAPAPDPPPGHATARMAWEVAPGPGLVPDARVACIVRF
ncbi:MAG: hypothetical protein ABI960_04480 [Candidatus Eisenbacteria bacterium]